jgi:hypothetical protein
LRPRGVVRATFLQFELSMRGQEFYSRKMWIWLRNKRDKNLNVCEIENEDVRISVESRDPSNTVYAALT